MYNPCLVCVELCGFAAGLRTGSFFHKRGVDNTVNLYLTYKRFMPMFSAGFYHYFYLLQTVYAHNTQGLLLKLLIY